MKPKKIQHNQSAITGIKAPYYEKWSFQAWVIAGLVILFYGNTLFNGYALDDVMFITMNQFTQKGIKGIPDLITKESLTGFIGEASENTGGRWKPLALITFALEKQFLGKNPSVGHFNNILLYLLTGLALLNLLRKFVFPGKPVLSFCAVILFIIHPIHTEVIANIKSRDEILSFLFLVLSLHFALQYQRRRKIGQQVISLICFFLALSSKENGLSFFIIIPMSFYFLLQQEWKTSIKNALPHFGIIVLYLLIRFSLLGINNKEITEVMNAPFLYATPVQRLATVVMLLGKYLLLIFFPHPLSYDYSFNQYPYVDFRDFRVWVSITIHLLLLVYALKGFKKHNLISYGILFYLFSLFLVSNLVIDTGVVIGERFLYQPSFGFVIAITVLLNKGYSKVQLPEKAKKMMLGSVILIVFVLSGLKTISRNRDWKRDQDLFLADVNVSPNSARARNGAGTAAILLSDEVADSTQRRKLLQESISHLEKALQIHPKYVDPYLNLGVAYSRLGDYKMAEEMWNEARKRNPSHPKLVVEYDKVLAQAFLNEGLKAGQKKEYAKAINYFYHSLKYDNANAEIWYNLGGAYFTVARYDSAKIAWRKTLELNPEHKDAPRGLQALSVMK